MPKAAEFLETAPESHVYKKVSHFIVSRRERKDNKRQVSTMYKDTQASVSIGFDVFTSLASCCAGVQVFEINAVGLVRVLQMKESKRNGW